MVSLLVSKTPADDDNSTDLIENVREHPISVRPVCVLRGGLGSLPIEHVRKVREEVRRRGGVVRALLLGPVQ